VTPEELRTLGEASGIKGWQSWLAGKLGVDPRTVRRWLSGETRIRPPALAEKIRRILKRKPRKD
jgi:hypothetical protein